mmetsp:Transcript_20661/g.26077  ORF Transcript_20661/g.26077 Transcript_20661/m.26077 type:complete len:139 (+) Transcript_20661:59-475(+)
MKVGNYVSIKIGGKQILYLGEQGLNVVLISDTGSVISAHSFDTRKSKNVAKEFERFISGVEYGIWVFIAMKGKAPYHYDTDVQKVIKQVGSTKIDSLANRSGWCIIGKKGADAGTREENLDVNSVALCYATISFAAYD